MTKIILAFAYLLLSSCANNQPQIISGTTMGTTYLVKTPNKAINQAAIDKRLTQLSGIFSTWDKSSELSLLNQKPINQWHKVSAELFFVLQQSKAIYQQTQGYFDPSIGRLIDLWGFGVVKVENKPSRAQVHKILAYSSIKYLQLQAGKVKKTKPIHINLSAIAKGYAVDQIGQLLSLNKHQNFLVEIGGEVITRGKNAKYDWKIGIEMPNNDTPISQILHNQAVATSGNYRNYFVWENQRYTHILNPKNGLPVKNDLASVSVFHEQAMMADAYATAMMVMGSKQAIALANRLNLRLIMILDKSHQHKILRVNL